MALAKLDPRDHKRTRACINQDMVEARRDRQGRMHLEPLPGSTPKPGLGYTNHHAVTGPPEIALKARITAECERIEGLLAADADVTAGSVSCAWTTAAGTHDSIYLGLPDGE